jgi:arginyl-tRNA synthetase
MMRLIAQYPRVLESAALAHEPHRIAFHLYELASALHSFWNKGKDLPQLRFVNATDRKSTWARLALVEALRSTLAAGLAILGVTAPDEMR